MRPLLLNTFDRPGGAAIAARRLLLGLKRMGLDASMLVRHKKTNEPGVFQAEANWRGELRAWFDILPVKKYYLRHRGNYNPAIVPDGLQKKIPQFSPDLIHLHWVGAGFLRIESLAKFDLPVVWSLHDSWAFSGGCYLPGKCFKFKEVCQACPVLDTENLHDLANKVWQRKRNTWPFERMTFIAPSQWMANRAKSSALLSKAQIVVIPNGIDTELYKPGDMMYARQELGLPNNKKLLLFGANHGVADPNKGFDLLKEALSKIPESIRSRWGLVVVGGKDESVFSASGVEVLCLGELSTDDKMIATYRAADLFVLPSRQENLPNMLVEAMSCGTPSVAFNVGGVSEIIDHRVNGCVAIAGDTESLQQEIEYLMSNDEIRQSYAHAARDSVTVRFSLAKVVRQHMALYRQVISGHSPNNADQTIESL